MILSPKQKKLLHSLAIAFITGALTAAQSLLESGVSSKKLLIAAGIGVVAGGLSRVAGAVLAEIQTS